MNAFPIQAAKVQSPPLRDDILTRDRLLDWLHAKIHQRLVLVLAEAGYGKTTLLTDFSGRTRLRTLWYRLDEDDRDWVTVLNHLVAAGREHDPDFAPRTGSMLSDMGVTGPSREATLETFLHELPSIAEHGAVLILDDFHLVDEAPDVKLIARELVARAPERVSIVISSRRAPSIPIARLRAAGEVAELRTDDLRFDTAETARLFSETYGRPLEPDVLRDLSARTEGWAASLQLVQAALRDRSPLEIRRFVRNLTGADQELYDYLAEEVVGDLSEDLQQFLMRTSILQVVTPELAETVAGLPSPEVRRLTALAERYSLLSRRGSVQRDHLRYHPLVRDFLEDRLEREPGGRDAIAQLHRTVAEAFESSDWRTACHHYAQIGDTAAIGRTIDDSAEDIIARGDVLVACTYLAALGEVDLLTTHKVLRSRADLREGQVGRALERAQELVRDDAASPLALSTLASIAYRVGDTELAWRTAKAFVADPTSPDTRLLGMGLLALIEASVDADLRETLEILERLREIQRSRGHVHHEAITLLNMSVQYRVRGDAQSALACADGAIALLVDDQSGAEMAAARAARGWALAHLGDLNAARQMFHVALRDVDERNRAEILLEAAESELWYGSCERADDLRSEASATISGQAGLEAHAAVIEAEAAIRKEDLHSASSTVAGFRIGEFGVIAGLMAQQLTLRAHWAVASGDPRASEYLREAERHTETQGADFWLVIVQLLNAVHEGPSALNRAVRRIGDSQPAYLSILAETVVDRLQLLGEREHTLVLGEMEARPERWLPALRAAVDSGADVALAAARCLDIVGASEDILRLRGFSKRRAAGDPDLGRGLARRVAGRVLVEDQGRVSIRVGDRNVEGTAIRRKVLALLCFLLARPRFSSTRDEVLDALWPDSEPAVALNSLNQTVYFLRRVFEPSYREDASPGYVRHESDIVWLDRQLVSSRSQRCWDFIRSLGPRPSSDDVERLTVMYQGPFALDFAYEEWAAVYREALHAAYLQVIENAVASDMASGHWTRGIVTARRALAIDPDAEQIEASLVRLLRLSGAHAAAAEQYAHYSTVLREGLGLEPPPLDAL